MRLNGAYVFELISKVILVLIGTYIRTYIGTLLAGSRSGSAPVQSVTQKLQFEAMMTFLHLLTRILMENTSTFNVTAVAVIIGAKKKNELMVLFFDRQIQGTEETKVDR